ncbi:hypothetical protein GCM10022254_09560 [Actinomadura meridiana]|uniref:Uncharacterized protein n=1 Tax=Actinomadura meridiana TaxID=559626 RepID=A0ABP8BTQ6_9ACTN
MTDRERIANALDIVRDGVDDGAHHKQWAIDQMVRALTGCPMVDGIARDHRGEQFTCSVRGESEEYVQFVADYNEGDDGDLWETGIAP